MKKKKRKKRRKKEGEKKEKRKERKEKQATNIVRDRVARFTCIGVAVVHAQLAIRVQKGNSRRSVNSFAGHWIILHASNITSFCKLSAGLMDCAV